MKNGNKKERIPKMFGGFWPHPKKKDFKVHQCMCTVSSPVTYAVSRKYVRVNVTVLSLVHSAGKRVFKILGCSSALCKPAVSSKFSGVTKVGVTPCDD